MIQEFVQQIENTIRESTYDIHTTLPGTVVAFDPESGMATVKPEGTVAMKNGKRLKYPSIVKVPVVFPRGKDTIIAYPIKAGDGCLILICENDLKPWMSHGKETDSDMKFDLTNAVCIPGLYSDGNEIIEKAVEENSIIIKNKDMEVSIKEDEIFLGLNKGKTTLKITRSGILVEGNLYVKGNLEMEEAAVE